MGFFFGSLGLRPILPPVRSGRSCPSYCVHDQMYTDNNHKNAVFYIDAPLRHVVLNGGKSRLRIPGSLLSYLCILPVTIPFCNIPVYMYLNLNKIGD